MSAARRTESFLIRAARPPAVARLAVRRTEIPR